MNNDDLDMLQDDVDLDEVVDIDLDIDGEVMPPKNDFIALVDADTVAYTACLNVEMAGDILGRDFYTDEEWDEIVNNPNYDAEEGVLYETDPIVALAKAEEKLQRILDKTGCKEVELHFSKGKENFRYSIFPEYKSNRTARKPAGLTELKTNLNKKYKGAIHTKWEADDIVTYLKKTYPDKYILCAIDKDVLNSLEGKHFNYYESALYNKEMKWVEVDKYTAILWPYLQTLMGDKTDNIIGLRGIGPVRAQKLLNGKILKSDLWAAVAKAYKDKGRNVEEAVINMNLVNMHLLKDSGAMPSAQELYANLQIKNLTKEELENGCL